MAIGDCWTAFLGTAETNRQPSSGVFEQISYIGKTQSTDAPALYDGSFKSDLMDATPRSPSQAAAANAAAYNVYNVKILISNSHYLHKAGTTDIVAFGGVQVDA